MKFYVLPEKATLMHFAKIGMESTKCKSCHGDQWVCEFHPDTPFKDGKNCCGGAGMPCACNPISKTKERTQWAK